MNSLIPAAMCMQLVFVLQHGPTGKSRHRFIYETDLAYVPSQKIVNTTCDEKKFFPNLNEDTAFVDAFYMSRTEVTNFSYHEFLNYLAVQEDDSAALERNFPDTLVWVNNEAYMYEDPSTNYYFWHPAYDNFPVVGLTHTQCLEYCAWLTRVYNNDPDRKFKKVEFTLPDRKQFIAASICGKAQRLFSFPGIETNGKKGPMLNIDNRRSFEVRWTDCLVDFKSSKKAFDDFSYYTAKVISYPPNEYGIYNLCGNVEEFLNEYGYVKGGSWQDLLFDASLISEQHYSAKDEKSAQRGFRFVMRIIEE